MTHRFFRQGGFTLLEVLVALAVLAISLSAILKAAAEGAGNIGYLRDRTLASWVASNRINQALLTRDWPEAGSSRGTTEMAGREWRWELRVSNTPDADMRRLEVAVYGVDDSTAPFVEVAAFKGRMQ